MVTTSCMDSIFTHSWCSSFLCIFALIYEGLVYSQELIKKTGRALSDWIYLGGVKAFADGSLGSNSAFFFEVRIKILCFHSCFILILSGLRS